MKRRGWRSRSKQWVGVCAGFAVLALVPAGSIGSAPAMAATFMSPDAGDSSDEPKTLNPDLKGSATWTGTDWIIVDAPEGEEVIPEPPLDLTPTNQIDADYAAWERYQTKIAEVTLVQRLANDDYVAKRMNLRNEYLKWERRRAADAHERLEHRLELANEAAAELDRAASAAEKAQQSAQNAVGTEQGPAGLAILEAAKAVETARQAHLAAQDLVTRHQERAIFEANHLKNAEAAAVAALHADRSLVSANGMGVRAFDEPQEMVTTALLNVRRGPGAGYEKLGELFPGTAVKVTGKGHGFYRLHDGGFVPVDYLVEPSAAPELTETGLMNTGLTDTGMGGGFGNIPSGSASTTGSTGSTSSAGATSSSTAVNGSSTAAGTSAAAGAGASSGTTSTTGTTGATSTTSTSGTSGTSNTNGVAEPASKYAFESYVANVDSQDAVDSCTGGLTYSPDISKILGKSYYPIHNFCGGMPILELKNGDKVNVQGVGVYTVVDSKDVNRGDTTSVIKGVKGDILLQTCYPNSTKMRVVGLAAA